MKRKWIIISSAALIHIGIINAQSVQWNEQTSRWEVVENKSITDDWKNTEINSTDNYSVYIPESLEANSDSLLKSWHINYYTQKDKSCNNTDQSSFISDEVYKERLSRLPHIMEMVYNDPVRNYIELYTERRRSLVQYMLGMADFYFPMIEQALDKYDLPIELKYLAVIESALNPTALSRAGASGLWQFMLPTGKIYDLEINSLIDERRDPVKSTYAACRYLKDMYNIYGDWNLVIAAYNCGPGNVNKAIKRSGGKKDYWAIYNYLPRETRSYVPLFIAANYVMNYYCEHDICPVKTDLPLSTDTVMIDKPLHLDQVASVLKIDKEQLQTLNPQYKKDIIPGNNFKPYSLRLPLTYSYAFIDATNDIYNYRSDEFFTNRATVRPGTSYTNNTIKPNSSKVYHQVQKGETLAQIANEYGVTTIQIRHWNNLKSNKVVTGKRLIIYADNGGFAYKSNNNDEDKDKATNQSEKPLSSQEYKKYKVKSGDSFYTIAKKYPGIEARELMKFNNMKSSNLKVGQIIKIPVA